MPVQGSAAGFTVRETVVLRLVEVPVIGLPVIGSFVDLSGKDLVGFVVVGLPVIGALVATDGGVMIVGALFVGSFGQIQSSHTSLPSALVLLYLTIIGSKIPKKLSTLGISKGKQASSSGVTVQLFLKWQQSV